MPLRILGLAALAAMLSQVSLGAKAQTYIFDATKRNPALLRAWQAIAPKDYARQEWISKLEGVTTPMDSISMHGKPFYLGAVCIPHDCGGNFVAFLIAKDGKEAHGALSSETLGVRLRYFGAPDSEARRLLSDKLAN